MENSYRWWAVDCKTPKCETTIGLLPSKSNPAGGLIIPFYILKQCAPFEETCPECGVEHTDYRTKVKQIDSDPPPAGWRPNPEFLKVIEPKEEEPGE